MSEGMIVNKWVTAAIEYQLPLFWTERDGRLLLKAMTWMAENGGHRYLSMYGTYHIFDALHASLQILRAQPRAGKLDASYLCGNDIDIWRFQWNPDLYLNMMRELRSENQAPRERHQTDWHGFRAWRKK